MRVVAKAAFAFELATTNPTMSFLEPSFQQKQKNRKEHIFLINRHVVGSIRARFCLTSNPGCISVSSLRDDKAGKERELTDESVV